MKENYLKVNYSARSQNTHYDLQLVTHLLGHSSPPIQAGTVLDIACGTGGFRPIFQQLGFEYHGVDIDNAAPTLNITKVDIGAEPLPFPDSSFDLLFFKMGIEHLDLKEISYSLSQMRRVMKPKASLVVLTPNWLWMYDVFYREYTHRTPFTPESLRTALEMSGLKCRHSHSLIQLPVVWKYPAMKHVCDLAYLLYPLLPRIRFVRYSKERVVFAMAAK